MTGTDTMAKGATITVEKEPQTLAEWLRRAMDERGLSLRMIQMYADVARTTAEGILQGVQPKPPTIAKLAAYFGVDPDYLWKLSQNRPSPFDQSSVDIHAEIIRIRREITHKWGRPLTESEEQLLTEMSEVFMRDKLRGKAGGPQSLGESGAPDDDVGTDCAT